MRDAWIAARTALATAMIVLALAVLVRWVLG